MGALEQPQPAQKPETSTAWLEMTAYISQISLESGTRERGTEE